MEASNERERTKKGERVNRGLKDKIQEVLVGDQGEERVKEEADTHVHPKRT